jgi:hypothetical protein
MCEECVSVLARAISMLRAESAMRLWNLLRGVGDLRAMTEYLRGVPEVGVEPTRF